jgi:uncharacterized repeat protein (TIGR03803 family)
MQSKKSYSTAKMVFAIFVTFLLASVVAPVQLQAQKFKVLHTFHGGKKDGSGPLGVLVLDSAGNLYGTTTGGGTGRGGLCNNSNKGTSGCSTVFKMSPNGKLIWLYSFPNFGREGAGPMAGVLRDKDGNLYGTTTFGGDFKCYSLGCGVVFEVDATGNKGRVLHNFKGGADGENPESLLVGDDSGNVYGTTYDGGGTNYGVVFKVDQAGKETILHTFGGPPDGGGDGAFPYPGVIRDAAGNLYGVTDAGGDCCGVVYRIDITGKETLLYSFTGGSDGGGPFSVLAADAAGNLYGTTKVGGNSECGGYGCGVVFELSPQSKGYWTEATLYTFCSQSDCADGQEPFDGPLVRDAAGNIYGTTYFGGTSHNCGGVGCGVVFKLDPSGNETVLHSFTNGADGNGPWPGLAMDAAGNLYGVTTFGGDTSCDPPNGCGVVFKITP